MIKKNVIQRQYLIPFVIITSLFALWGFANDITNPMVAAFQKVMEISNTKVTLVQFAFYGGYFTIALMFYPTGQICIPKRKTKLKYITGVPYGITTMLSVFLLPAFVIFFKETEPQPKLL